jgi:hypothetical protein
MREALRRTAIAVRHVLIAAALLSMLPIAAPAQTQQQYTPQPEDPESFPDGPGRDDAFYACGACHSFKLVASQGFSRERWDETIDLMTERHGAPKLDGKDREIILNYLAKTFPPKPQQNRGFQNPFLKQ